MVIIKVTFDEEDLSITDIHLREVKDSNVVAHHISGNIDEILSELEGIIQGKRVYTCGLFTKNLILNAIDNSEHNYDFLEKTLNNNHGTIKNLYCKHINDCRNSLKMVADTQGVRRVNEVSVDDLLYVYISIIDNIKYKIHSTINEKRIKEILSEFNSIHKESYHITKEHGSYVLHDLISNVSNKVNLFDLLVQIAHIIVIDYYENNYKYVTENELDLIKSLADIEGYHHMYD